MNTSPLACREQIAENVRQIRERMQAAYAGRNDKQPKLIAVTKYARDEWVEALLQLGECQLGESRPQQLKARSEQFARENNRPCWHMIGQLQRNKVRSIIDATAMVHSVDSLRLLNHIDRIAGEVGVIPALLLQVNVSGEESKSGFSPEEIRAAAEQLTGFTNVQISGLMTLAPKTDDEQTARQVFSDLRQMRDELQTRNNQLKLTELSMGMTNDFEWAIQEGSTMVRIGSGLYAGCEAE
ncbi:YggS family pyridoxal phosphate-dependent enzyme [Rubinisphaera sp. JC750]|uniref:YggS family pyridoxal phosphate-dependent enzyme n=1 Tax=Rubinisphaera sp. JC750 TaxID=2898658 RepID=UPI001F015701|nr:YggS family pyridoxal phosphate-dependent enzyme [Rubinisphaera sp. JC750]